jgi:transposase
MSRARKYPEELLERGVRLVFESGRPIAHVAADLGIGAETLRKRVRQAEADSVWGALTGFAVLRP